MTLARHSLCTRQPNWNSSAIKTSVRRHDQDLSIARLSVVPRSISAVNDPLTFQRSRVKAAKHENAYDEVDTAQHPSSGLYPAQCSCLTIYIRPSGQNGSGCSIVASLTSTSDNRLKMIPVHANLLLIIEPLESFVHVTVLGSRLRDVCQCCFWRTDQKKSVYAKFRIIGLCLYIYIDIFF